MKRVYALACALALTLASCSAENEGSSNIEVKSSKSEEVETSWTTAHPEGTSDVMTDNVEDFSENFEEETKSTTTYKSLVSAMSSGSDLDDTSSVPAEISDDTDLNLALSESNNSVVNAFISKIGSFDAEGKLLDMATKDVIIDTLGADLKKMKQDYTQDESLRKSYLYSWVSVSPEQWANSEIFGGYTRVYDESGNFLRLKLCKDTQDSVYVGFDSYVPRNQLVNYFCIHFQDAGGGWIFIPLVAGTDETGYYLIPDTWGIYGLGADITKPDNLF